MAEVAFEGVAVDHYPVLVHFAGDAVSEVLAVGVRLGPQLGDDDGNLLELRLELVGEAIDRVGDHRLEVVHRFVVGHS